MDPRVQTVLSLMRKNLHRKFKLSEMARSVNLSPWWLCRLFKEETGITPDRYQQRLRMEKAKELLEGSFLSVKEVMTAVGFIDESHFVRKFKKTYSLTPGRYRARHFLANSLEEHKAEPDGKI